MWDLKNRTRFAAERTFARARDGAEVLLVAIKATFEIGEDGSLRVADAQVPIAMTPLHSGEPGRSSLIYESDFALAKSETDILLLGHARTVQEKPSIAVEVQARVGAWQKRVVVFGDRRWDSDLTGFWLSEPVPFVSMPLVYERAYGGKVQSSNDNAVFDANPVGVGFAESFHPTIGANAPNLEDPENLLTKPEERPRPMCFGPIAREWPARNRLAGTFDERWRRERRPLVPNDFDDAFWQSAPPDQRASLRGGEAVELVGVSSRGALRFELPRLAFSFHTRMGGQTVEHSASLQTLLFEPDHDRVVLVFQSALPCHHTIQSLERTIIEEVIA